MIITGDCCRSNEESETTVQISLDAQYSIFGVNHIINILRKAKLLVELEISSSKPDNSNSNSHDPEEAQLDDRRR